MYALFVVGTAGSGKSALTSSLIGWLNERGNYAVGVNLDPGALTLPYEPDVDVRNYIDIMSLMKEMGLGPNGALILASDLLASRLKEVQEELESLNPDYAIFDTPGQLELFSFRESGPYIARRLVADEKAVVFLFDGPVVSSPRNFVSIALLSASVQLRLGLPQVAVLSKSDLVEDVERILELASDPFMLEEELRKEGRFELSVEMLRGMERVGMGFGLLPVSSKTLEGFVELSASLTRIFRGGEEIGE